VLSQEAALKQQPPDQSTAASTAGSQQLQGTHVTPSSAGHQQPQPQQQAMQQQWQQYVGPLPLKPVSMQHRMMAEGALSFAASALTGPINKLVLTPIQQQLQDLQQDPDSLQLLSKEQALTLVSGFCPGASPLLLLDEAATVLQDRVILEYMGGEPAFWSSAMLTDVSFSQLQYVGGLKRAVAGIKDPPQGWPGSCIRLAAQLTQLLTDSAQTRRSMRTFFWMAVGLLREKLGQGVAVCQSSNASAEVALQEYVLGTAHVARLLVQIHNMLLPQKAAAAATTSGVQQQLQGPQLRQPSAGGKQLQSWLQAPVQPMTALLPKPRPQDDPLAATVALSRAAAGLNLPVYKLISSGTLQTQPGKPDLVQLLSTEDIITLASGFCPGLGHLLALAKAATPLLDRDLPAPGLQTMDLLKGWQRQLLSDVPDSQLQSTTGIVFAVHGVKPGVWVGPALGEELKRLAKQKSLRSFF
jgi:hypothetical protein